MNTLCLASLTLFATTLLSVFAEDPSPAELVERAKNAPCLLFTKTQLTEIKAKLETDAMAQKWWRSFIKKTSELCAKAPPVPDRGGQWILWYNCRKCGADLKVVNSTLHICTKCGEQHEGQPYDDAAIMKIHYGLAECTRNCGIAALITGEKAYADCIRTIMLGYAEKYAGYEWHNRNGACNGPRRGGARLAAQVLDESTCLLKLLDGYDAIRADLTAADREKIETGFLRPSVETILSENAKWSNHECWHLAAYGTAGLVLGDVALVDKALNSEYGSLAQLKNGILPDGCWWEVSMHYHLYTIDSFLAFYRPLANLGLRPPDALRAMLRAPFGQIGPDGRFAAINDSWARTFMPGDASQYYELAYAWWGDEDFGWWVNQKPRSNSYYALWGRRGIPATPLTFQSCRYDASGLAVLRTRTPGFTGKTVANMPDNCLMMDYGPHGKWHGHPDKLHLTFWGHGRQLAEDPGCLGYGNPMHWGWYKSTLAHNTIVIDGRNQLPAEGHHLGWYETNNIVAVAADAGPIAEGVTARRMSALLGDVLIDCLWTASDAEHQYECVFHGQGKLTTSVTTEPVTGLPPRPKKNPHYGRDWSGEDCWSWVDAPRKGPHAGTWTATWRAGDQPLMQLVQRSAAGELWSGIGGALTPPRKTPFVANRVNGRAAAFCSVLTCGEAAVEIGDFVTQEDGTVSFTATVNGTRHSLSYSERTGLRVE